MSAYHNGQPIYCPRSSVPLIRSKLPKYGDIKRVVAEGIASGAITPARKKAECCRADCDKPIVTGSIFCAQHRGTIPKPPRKLIQKICITCGKQFGTHTARARNCSTPCKRLQQQAEARAMRARKEAQRRPCLKCGEVFLPGRVWAKFCNTCRTSPGWGYWYERWLDEQRRVPGN